MYELPQIPVEKLVEDFFSNHEYYFPTTLCAIMESCGSDKGGENAHNYTTLYSKLFSAWKDKEISLFELGIGTNQSDVFSNMGPEGKPGASLYGWSLFFPKGKIYGADIDKRILFKEKNINTFYCNELDISSIQEMFSNEYLKEIRFDVIVEDGLHLFEAQRNFFENSIHKLKKGGIYIAEDLQSFSRSIFNCLIPECKKKFNLRYMKVIEIPSITKPVDNALLIIQK